MSDDKLIREIHAKTARTQGSAKVRGHVQGVAEYVDLAGTPPTAWIRVQGDDSVPLLPITAMHGFLPREGDTVMLSLNGADPFVLAPRTMVEGDMQSIDFETGVSGWQITALGNAEFNDVVVRGTINGVRPGQPPLGLFRNGTWTGITTSTTTTLTDWVTAWANVAGTDGDSSYDVGHVWTNDAWIKPGRVGLWRINSAIAWRLQTNSELGVLRHLTLARDRYNAAAWANGVAYIVGDVVAYSSIRYVCISAHTSFTAINRPSDGSGWTARWELYATSSTLDAMAPSAFTVHNVSNAVIVTHVDDVYSLRVWQDSGSTIDIEAASWLWEFLSEP